MKVSNQRIKWLRKERGWSQEQLSMISGLSERTIQRIEKSGDCSLDSQMALASAFELSPQDLEDHMKSQFIVDESAMEWESAIGYICLLILLPIILFVLTNTHGIWEISCLLIVDGLTIALSTSSHGFEETIRFFTNTFFAVKKTARVTTYNTTIIHARQVCQNFYIIGFVTTLIYLLTYLIHMPERSVNMVLVEASIPMLYAILLAEFWIRPFKHKIEKQLAEIREIPQKKGSLT